VAVLTAARAGWVIAATFCRLAIDLRRAKRGGTLIFHFYSDEELDALADHLLKAG